MKSMPFLLFSSILMTVFLFGCKDEAEPTPITEGVMSERQAAHSFSIWLPEWIHAPALTEANRIANQLTSVRVFGVYFDEADEPLLTNHAITLLKESEEQFSRQQDVILTFINDIVLSDGGSIQKDAELVHRIVQDKTVREQHIKKILQIAEEYGVDGVEIDFEKMNKEDISDFLVFIEELYEALSAKDLSLHVVLQPSFPFGKNFPDGPSYSVMAYNEYGPHSGPGPKASYAFLESLLNKLKKANQKIDIALAADGFIWFSDEKVKMISTEEAGKLVEEKKATTKRDSESGALSFTYEDEAGEHEVWFADATTIEKWVGKIREIDSSYEHFLLWRAGGLGEEMIEWIQGD